LSRKSYKGKGARVVRRLLADGTTKEYCYAPWQPKRQRIPADSVDALLAAYRRSPEWAALKPATRATYSIYLRLLDRIGHLPVTAMKRRDLLEIRDGVATKRGNGAGTGFQRAASSLMAWALDRGWIEYHPLARAKALPSGHLPAWSDADAAAALAALPEPYRRVVILGMHTGQRRGDLIAMTWGQYDGATIRLRQQKTGAVLVIPAHPALRVALEEWKAGRQAAVILTSPQGRPWTAQHLSREMGKVLASAGLPGLNVHGLRKLAAGRLAEAGCTPHEIQSITGHRTLSMVELYTRGADQERLAGAAIAKLTTAHNRRLKD
jgi:integrase